MLILMPEERSLPISPRNVAKAKGALRNHIAWCPPPQSVAQGAAVNNLIHPARFAGSLAITVGALYLLCALLSAIAPDVWTAALGLVAHGVNMLGSAQQPEPAGLLHALAGALVVMVCGASGGLLFAWIHNFSQRSYTVAA